MSLVITVYVNEGIVMASDRRSTYTQTQKNGNTEKQFIGVHVTDSTEKTFVCPNGAGISICGDASLLNKPITGYIQDMIRHKILPDTLVNKMPELILEYFSELGQQPDITLHIAGYENCNQVGPLQVIKKLILRNAQIETIDIAHQGATWSGEALTLSRLIKPVALIQPNGQYIPLPQEEIAFQYFTLQDAVNFARYAIDTTIKTLHFKNVVETVGGEIDILVITPDKTKWLAHHELK